MDTSPLPPSRSPPSASLDAHRDPTVGPQPGPLRVQRFRRDRVSRHELKRDLLRQRRQHELRFQHGEELTDTAMRPGRYVERGSLRDMVACAGPPHTSMEQPMPDSPWTVTEDAWSDLCFLVLDLGMTTQRLYALVLAPDRPSLPQVQQTTQQLQAQTDQLMDYLRTYLRAQVEPTDIHW